MPYKSASQRRFFHAAEARGDISSKTVNEFDKASKGKKLPEKVKKYAKGGEVMGFAKSLIKHKILENRKKLWRGGEVETDESDSNEVLRRNSTGEPHTNDRLSSKSPMEYEEEQSVKDFGIDSKYKGPSNVGEDNYKRLPDSNEYDPYEKPQDKEIDPNFVEKMFKGGVAGQQGNYPDPHAEDEEDFMGSVEEDGPQGRGNYPRGEAPDEYPFKKDVEDDGFEGHSNYQPSGAGKQVVKLAMGGVVPESEKRKESAGEEYNFKDELDNEEDFGEQGYSRGGLVKRKKMAHGGVASSKDSLAMHLKKKMRGY